MKKYNKLFAILFAVLGVGTLSAQTEIISDGSNLNLQYNFGSPSNHTIPELWTSDARQGFNFSQAVELPNGVYTLSFQMMYRASLTEGTETNCALYAETSGEVYNTPIKNFGDESGTEENLDGVTSAMNSGKYFNTIPYFIVTDGRATVGARSLGSLTHCTNGYWTIWNPASFKLKSVEDETTLTQVLNDLKGEVDGILEEAPESDAKATLQAVYDEVVATSEDIVALKNAIKAYLPNTGTATAPVDVSSLILSADFSNKAFIVATKNNNSKVSAPELQPVGWTCTDTGNGQYNFFNVLDNSATYDEQSNFAYNGKTAGQTLYMRHAWGTASLVAKQTIKLPNGRYKISIPAKKTGNTATVKYTFANQTETHDVTTSWAVYEKMFTVNEANNELTIELTYNHPGQEAQRAFFDGVTLLCYGDPIKALVEEISTKASELRGYENQVPQAVYNGYSEFLTAADNANNSMEESALQTILDNLNVAINNAVSLVTPYANVQALINVSRDILDNSVEFEDGAGTTFSTAVNTASTAIEAATTTDAINAIYKTLEDARHIYVLKADPTNDTYFDYTFLMTNPEVSTTSDWTNGRYATNEQYTGAPDNCYLDSWNGAGQNIYQELTGLPSGLYTLKAAGRASTSCTSAYIYLNDTKAEIEKTGNTGNNLGNGWNWYTTEKTAVAGTAKVGFGCNTTNSQWAGADDFHLYYYGFDVTTAQNSVTTLKTEAEALVGKPMNAVVATALGEAIAGADASKATRNELDPMIADLSTAIADAEASIAAYETIATYIAKANKIDESIAADYQTAYNNGTLESAETVFQELEVATYGYVKDEFSYPVELPAGNWVAEGPTGSKNEQHWSGEQRSYLEQSSSAWEQNAWSISYKQDKTLPAGDYVFKVSGRRAAGTGNTLSLVVTNINDPENPVELGVVNDFPEGDTGLGINKNGVTSFDAEDEAGFANNNNGRGWQWRYVKFTLTSETTVQVAVEAEATTTQQWISFCDATLQMTEDTYLDANMGALDAPTAAAEALVDTKPMGAAENTALKDALALPVTTGAELLAKIEALETAVANANAWVAAYNEAKAPLVAALERFETDYNDGANGCLYHLQKDAWNTVILEVEDAVTAKDVTDSYDGFDDATTELVAALDAAQASIDMYAKLNAEIAYAQAYTPLIEGNAAGHTAAITAAQNAYDAAEIADASELILAMQNYKVLDYQYVVANYDKEFELGDWTGQTHTNKGEHWNGQDDATYFDYSKWSDGYKNGANEATQSVTLPAGDYVLMAAGRAASVDGTEAYIKVNETQVNYDARGGVGRGIDTDGTASFAEDGTYANKDGRGWEYRFIEFTLTKTTEVTLTAGMVIDEDASSLSWAGVCTPVLLTRALDVTLEISDANWATLILPFDATLPEGVKAYSCGETDGENLTLVETESIEANTPYLVSGKKGSYNFSGYSLAEKDSYTVGLFTGTYVEYQTTAGSNTYVLQNGEEGVAFYRVGESAQPIVKAYRCYMTYVPEEGENAAPMFSLGRGEGTTSIDNAQLTNDKVVIYDLMGRKVTTMMKGGMYIVNGKKVVIR